MILLQSSTPETLETVKYLQTYRAPLFCPCLWFSGEKKTAPLSNRSHYFVDLVLNDHWKKGNGSFYCFHTIPRRTGNFYGRKFCRFADDVSWWERGAVGEMNRERERMMMMVSLSHNYSRLHIVIAYHVIQFIWQDLGSTWLLYFISPFPSFSLQQCTHTHTQLPSIM